VTVGVGVPDPALKSVTILLLLLKLIGTLRALEAFGFLVSMLVTTAWMMKDFVLLFVLFVSGFGFIFTVLFRPDDGGEVDGKVDVDWLAETMWTTYLLTVMGDFDSDAYWASPWLVLFFGIITFIMNIILLNVLISIVGEGYGLAQANKAELGRLQRAGIVCDLEATYLRPFYSQVAVRRGHHGRLIKYPEWLLRLSRCVGTSSNHTLIVKVPKAFPDEEPLSRTSGKHDEFTERAMIKRMGEDLARQMAELREQIATLAAAPSMSSPRVSYQVNGQVTDVARRVSAARLQTAQAPGAVGSCVPSLECTLKGSAETRRPLRDAAGKSPLARLMGAYRD